MTKRKQTGTLVGFETRSGLDTVIVGAQGISARVATRELSVTFRANDTGVRFECKADELQRFATCPTGSTYRFTNLVDGSKHDLWVRSVKIDGSSLDPSPAHLSFTVDLSNGEPLFSENTVAKVQDESSVMSSSEVASRIEDNLPLAISPFYQILVPSSMILERMVTRQTASSTIFVLEALASGAELSEESPRCTQDWQRQIYIRPYDTNYCEGTPTDIVWQQSGRSSNYDALELARWEQNEAVEQLVFFASYGSEGESNEIAQTAGFCRNPTGSGVSYLRDVDRNQADYRPGPRPMKWCRVWAQGKYWWTAQADLRLLPAEGSPRMMIHYAVAESEGIRDIGSFTRHFQNFVIDRVNATGAR